MKLLLLFAALSMMAIGAGAQTLGAVYRVQFTDKNNSPYSIGNPQEFLTQRAIDRRQSMGIAIDETDIPVVQAYIDSLSQLGASVLNRSHWFNTATVFLTDTTIVSQIEALTFVSEVVKTKPYLTQKKLKPFKTGTQSDVGNIFNQSVTMI